MVRSFVVACMMMGVALAGCVGDFGEEETRPEREGAPPVATAPAGYPELQFDAVQEGPAESPRYGLQGPSSAPAGWTRVTLHNDAPEPHQVLFLKLEENQTYADFVASLEAAARDPQNATQPEALRERGGVGAVSQGQSGTVILDLEEGEYAVVCFIPGPMGPHAFHGMSMPFTVTAAEGEPLPEPEADATVLMREYGYGLQQPIEPGERAVAFRNEGTQPHEAPLVALQEGASVEEFLAALELPEGPPPGELVGGVVNMEPGQTVYAVHDFREGEYGVFCFVSDRDSGKPHLAHGMMAQFDVG